EVRDPDRRAALADLPDGHSSTPGCAVHRRLPPGDGPRLRDPPARFLSRRRAPHLLGPDARVPARPRIAVLALGLGPVPRTRDPGSRVAPGRRPGVRDRPGGRRRGASAHEGPTGARGAHGGVAPRLRALVDALVVPLVLLALFLPRSGRPAEPEAPETTEAAPPEMAGVS